MKGALIIIALIIISGAIAWGLDRILGPRLGIYPPKNQKTTPQAEPQTDQCCGTHAICEKIRPTADPDQIIYFDDHELDAFAHQDPATYTPDQIETFRDILLTLPPQEIPQWEHSLTLRSITPPEEIRQEMIMILIDHIESTTPQQQK